MLERELFALLERTADAAYVVTTEGQIRAWNAAAELLFGYSRDEVLGRDPAIDSAQGDAAPIALSDPARSVSKTHALVEVVDEVLTVTDLHSTNGTRVAASDGRTSRLEPGQRTPVPVGSTMVLGEFALRVDRAPLDTV